MFPLSLLPSRGILDPDCALVLRNSCIVSRETAGKTHGTFIFCTHKYRNSSVQALPYPCSRGCFLFLRQPPLQFIYPPQRFCSFSPGLFAKRPTSPRRSALYSTAYARGTRRSALILRKIGNPHRARRKARRRGSFHHSALYLPCPNAPLPFPPLCAPATLPVVAADAPVPWLPLHHMASPACIARLCTRTIMPA